jgi:ABC-type nitrate/sulfonate/bicarbonate transport system substrate-binding protein
MKPNMRLKPSRPVKAFIGLIPAGIFAGILLLSACQRDTVGNVESITIGVPPLEQNALLYVAESQKSFDKNALKVIIKDYDTGVATINALLNGEVDMAEAAEFPFLKMAFQRLPVRIVAVNDRFENDYLIVRKDRGVNNVADLEGKRIGIIRGTILEFYLGRFLELHRIHLQAVAIVNTATASGTADAIVKGEVDAAVIFQPYVDSIQGQLGDKAMIWPVQNSQLVYGILVLNADWLTRHKGMVQRFLKCLAEAENYLATHPNEARAIVQKRLNLDSAYMAAIWPQHQFSLSLDQPMITAMRDEANWMIRNKLTTEEEIPDFADFIYTDGLKAVKPEAVNIIR